MHSPPEVNLENEPGAKMSEVRSSWPQTGGAAREKKRDKVRKFEAGRFFELGRVRSNSPIILFPSFCQFSAFNPEHDRMMMTE
jgi:hypothetical protein